MFHERVIFHDEIERLRNVTSELVDINSESTLAEALKVLRKKVTLITIPRKCSSLPRQRLRCPAPASTLEKGC